MAGIYILAGGRFLTSVLSTRAEPVWVTWLHHITVQLNLTHTCVGPTRFHQQESTLLLQAQAARRRCGDNAGDRDEMGESRAAGSTPPTLLPPLAVEGAPPRFLVEDLLLPCSSGAAPLLDHLRVHGWVVLRDTAPGVDLFVAVEESWRAFFSEEDGAKKRHKQSPQSRAE